MTGTYSAASRHTVEAPDDAIPAPIVRAAASFAVVATPLNQYVEITDHISATLGRSQQTPITHSAGRNGLTIVRA
jgi:hypothetical protein